MQKRLFSIGMSLVLVLGLVFTTGGVSQVQAEAAYLDDIAGISAYAEVTPAEGFLANAKSACEVDGLGDPVLEVDAVNHFICSVAIEGYADIYAPHVFVALTETTVEEITTSTGWIMAYYLADEPAAKMIDVIAQPLVDPLDPTVLFPTLLEQAVGTVATAAGTVDPEISLFDFSNPDATGMLLVAEDKAEDEGLLGDDDHWFTIALPAGTYYEFSYGFYQNYYPLFAKDGTNFVLTNADYVGPQTLGSIYGDLDKAGFVPLESYLFEVDTMSLAPAGYGALLVTYSGEIAPVIESADWIEEFELVTPPTALTDLFNLDFAPAAFAKVEPVDISTDIGTSVTLTWGTSAGATGYEYCIDKIEGTVCDTDWVSTGTATSVYLSGLPYNATYYWQVRAVNSYATTEADGGTWWSFATITGAPAAFSKLSPFDKAIDVATSPLLYWADAEGAEYYEYCIAVSTVVCDTWVNTGLVSQAVVNLEVGTEYKWQVRAVNTEGYTNADGGVSWVFTTVQSTFSKVSPKDETTDVEPKATLSWGDMLKATGYEYCIDTTNNNSCSRWVSAGTATSVTLKQLKFATQYYWQVRAVTTTGTIEADDYIWWTFTTRDRKAPIKQTPVFDKVSPADDATLQPVVDLLLDWEDVEKATSYEYCLDTIDDNKCITWVKTDVSQTILTGPLPYGTTFYWQVRATVAGIVGYADGGYWAFTTELEPEQVIVP